jgi:acetyl-CoA synthase
MSKIIATAAIRGAHAMVARAEEDLQKMIEKKGKDVPVAYPNTAYYLPIMLLFLGQKVQKLGDLEESLQEAKKLWTAACPVSWPSPAAPRRTKRRSS